MTHGEMDATAVICTYNRAASLRNALGSLRALDIPPGLRWEVLVVDNNSSDSTREVVQEFETFLPVRHLFEGRPGKSHALNTAVREARGRVLAFTDDDAIVDRGWLRAIFETFESGAWDGIGGRTLLRTDREMPQWLKKELWGFLACMDFGDESFRMEDPQVTLIGVNMALRREVFERLGGFDEGLGPKGKALAKGEDSELFQRMLQAGMSIVYQPAAIVHHVVAPERLRKSYFRGVHYESGRVWGMRRDDLNGRAVFGVPLFLFPQLMRSAAVFLSEGLRHGFHNVFRKEMNIWFHLGFMRGRMMTQSRRMQ